MKFRFIHLTRRGNIIFLILDLITLLVHLILLWFVRDFKYIEATFYLLLFGSIVYFVCLVLGIVFLIDTYNYFPYKRNGKLINIETHDFLLFRKNITFIIEYIDSNGNKRVIKSREISFLVTPNFSPVDYYSSYCKKVNPTEVYFYIHKRNGKAMIEGLVEDENRK